MNHLATKTTESAIGSSSSRSDLRTVNYGLQLSAESIPDRNESAAPDQSTGHIVNREADIRAVGTSRHWHGYIVLSPGMNVEINGEAISYF